MTNANSFEDTILEEPMEVDDSLNASTPLAGDQNLIQFIIDVLTAAGHHFSAVQIAANPDRKIAFVRSKMVPFLRCVAIFAHFLTDVPLPKLLVTAGQQCKSTPVIPKLSHSEEYDLLCHYLGIPSNFSVLGITYLRQVALFWPRHSRISNMFTNESSSTGQSPTRSGRTTLKAEFAHVLQPHRVNQLQQLPHDYSDLINSLAKFTCPNSKAEESRYPTMCLVCGEVLCSQNYCCQKRLKGEMIGACTYHAQFCGAGTSIFLRVRDCKILLLSTRGRGT